MNRQSFRQLLKHYVSGTATKEEKALVNHWYDLLYSDSTAPLSAAQLNAFEQEIWEKIAKEGGLMKPPAATAKIGPRKMIIGWVAAAAIVAGISFGIYGIYSSKPPSVAYRQMKERYRLAELVNSGSVPRKLALEDGTVITLKPSSKLSYPAHFADDKREVYLEGEAFFSVAKNPSKPFLVHSGSLVTKVLGTSFTIRPGKKNGQMIVLVKTGRVAVYEDREQVTINKEQQQSNGAIITANQQVLYDAGEKHFAASLAENPEPVYVSPDSTAPVFSYDDATLATVLENLGRVYGIDISVETENIYQCRFTGDITRQSLFDKLELICRSTGHQYEIRGTAILLTGKGCN